LRRRVDGANFRAHAQLQLRSAAPIPVNIFDPTFLFASLLWGSVGVAYCVYGKRQQEILPLVGGVVMIVTAYFIGSALLMSLICIGVIVSVYLLMRRG